MSGPVSSAMLCLFEESGLTAGVIQVAEAKLAPDLTLVKLRVRWPGRQRGRGTAGGLQEALSDLRAALSGTAAGGPGNGQLRQKLRQDGEPADAA